MDCHLADMLQQLTVVTSAKPSERVAVRQGEAGDSPAGTSCCVTCFSVTPALLSEVRGWKAEKQ